MKINELYELAKTGDRTQENRLFESMSDRFLVLMCQRVWDAEDASEIVQDTLVKIAGMYKDIEIEVSFSAWAYKVLLNEFRNYVRKKKRRADAMETRFHDECPPKEWQADLELEPRLLDCIRRLAKRNLRYVRVLNLSHQGYSAQEICQKLNLTSGNFYVALSRARAMLKHCLEKGDVNL